MRTSFAHGGRHVGSAARFIASSPPGVTATRASFTGLGSAVILLSLSAPGAFAADICVFTDHAHPILADGGTRVVELDAPTRLIAALGAHLPADPRRASELVAARLKEKGPAFQRDLAAAYQGVIEAWRLGIAKIPAVVVDHRYVVYGEPDVARARSWIETYRSAHP